MKSYVEIYDFIKMACGNGRHCTVPGDVCMIASNSGGFCTAGKKLRASYVDSYPFTKFDTQYSARPSCQNEITVRYVGDVKGNCGPDEDDPPCGPRVNRQCPWSRGKDQCCFVDPLDSQNGFCRACNTSISNNRFHVFSSDTFEWSVLS